MRTIALFLLLQALQVAAMTPAEADTLVRRAERAYAGGDAGTALQLYDSVSTAYTSAGLEYDRGNCHFQLGNMARAILHYERALRLDPTAEDVRTNLQLARSRLVDRIEDLPGMDLTSVWQRIGGMDAWAWRSVLFAWLFAALLAVALLPGRDLGWKRGWGIAAGLAGLLLVAAIAISMLQWQRVTDRSEAVLMEPRVQVRSAPGTGAKVLFVLHEGVKLTVLQEQDGFAEVRLANGQVGWLPSGSVERI